MENVNKKRGRPSKIKDMDTPFATRLRELGDNMTHQEIADGVGVSRQTIGQFMLGNTRPDIDTLGKLADFFNVSTDYLLCRTDIKSTDTTIQDICEYIGCNEMVIEQMKYLFKKHSKGYVDFLNLFFRDDTLLYLFLNIYKVNSQSKHYRKRFINLTEKIDLIHALHIARAFDIENDIIYNALVMPDEIHNKDDLDSSKSIYEQIDLSRYRATKILEELLNRYDKREEINNYTSKEEWLQLFNMTEDEFYKHLGINNKPSCTGIQNG